MLFDPTSTIPLKILDLVSHPWRPWGPCTIRDRSWSRLERPWRSWTAFGGPKVSRAGTSGVRTVQPTFLLGGHDQVMKAYMALIAEIAILSNVANDDNHGVLGLGVLIWVSVHGFGVCFNSLRFVHWSHAAHIDALLKIAGVKSRSICDVIVGYMWYTRFTSHWPAAFSEEFTNHSTTEHP